MDDKLQLALYHQNWYLTYLRLYYQGWNGIYETVRDIIDYNTWFNLFSEIVEIFGSGVEALLETDFEML